MFRSSFRGCLLFGAIAFHVVATGVQAEEPRPTSVSPRGLQIGQTTRLIFQGTGLGGEPVLLAPIAISRQQVIQATDTRLEIEVSLSEEAAAGIHAVRLSSETGISTPLLMSVDALPQANASELAENAIPATPLAITGELTGSTILQWTINGQKGQRLVCDVQARRLGSALQPVVRILAADETQLAFGGGGLHLSGDARCQATLPAAGLYFIQLHDRLYRGAGPGYFRMAIGELIVADAAFPLAIQRGTTLQAELLGSGLAPVELAPLLDHPGRWFAVGSSSLVGAMPHVMLSDHVELVENREAAVAQDLPAAPLAVSGRLSATRQTDLYRLPVTAGQKLRFELFSRRLGSPIDGVIVLRDSAGAQLARGDDQPRTTDPMVEFAPTEGMQELIVEVSDLVGRGDERCVYRLSVQPSGVADFSLSVAQDRLAVASERRQVWRVKANRQGYDGEIQLSLLDAPEGFHVDTTHIPAGTIHGLIAIQADAGTPLGGLVRIAGTGQDGERSFRRWADPAENAFPIDQPWLKENLALSRMQASPIGVDWGDVSENDQLFQGVAWSPTLALQRAVGTSGPVRLTLLTTQLIPKKTIKENDKEVVVDDTDRALRIQGQAEFAADQPATISLAVPADLPPQEYGLVVVADLLSEDQKSVIASVATPILRRTPQPPVTLTLDAAAEPINAVAGGGGEPGQITGAIWRAPGFALPLVVQLSGLPEGVAAPQVAIEADASSFALPLRLPYGSVQGAIQVKVAALADPGGETPKYPASRESAEVTLDVKLGERPPGEPPLVVFEDDDHLLGQLSKGGGTIALDAGQVYSGQASLKVTPDQRYNETVQGLGLKIREKPEPGEYRYLRFAWKKQGGTTICLQLNHDGAWGPGGSGKPGAKFRYHAGGDRECFGASVVLDAQPPSEFVVVTRDLFEDFGEFTLTGLALSPIDGDFALFDHILLARDPSEFGK